MSDSDDDSLSNAVAVVGMAGRFPGAPDVESLWRVSNLPGDTLRRFTKEELRAKEPSPAAVEAAENYVRVRGVLDSVEDFDADFFSLSPGDAAQLDPQHRLWLEVAWHALESAGYARDSHGQVVGVYTGTFPSTYLHHCLLRSRADEEEFVRMRHARSFAQMVNNDPAFLPTRTAHRFNLRGPAVNIQTACSTSLVAVGMGVQSLLTYETDIVLAGGVCVTIPQESGYFYQEGAIWSRDGTCRAYDAGACGTVFGNGAAAVVLRRLRDALDAGDTVLAIVRGIAINNDGSNKVSYLAPSVKGQAQAIVGALELATVSAATIGYVEGHGTGTPMGDPIEVEALSAAFRETTPRKAFCCLGSVKASIGHLDAAAGVAGLIRAIQALRHRTLPSTSHFVKPNPELRLSETPFFVLSAPKAWDEAPDHPRRAGVSAFGIGGTNVHAILEEAPAQRTAEAVQSSNPSPVALVLSGTSALALDAATADLKTWCDQDHGIHPEQWSLTDLAFTLAHRRRHFANRRAVAVTDWSDAVRALGDPNRWDTGISLDGPRQVVFAFPGQGSLRAGAAAAIIQHSPDFAQDLASYCAATVDHVDLDLFAWFANANARLSELTSGRPALQLAVFCFGGALATWLERRGVRPALCIGHSLGEWIAAHVAGVFTRADAVRAIAARDRWMRATGPGAGLVVSASAAEVGEHLGEQTWIACHNSLSHCMVSGRPDAVRGVAERLQALGIPSRLTDIDVAVHTPYMDEAASAFRRELAGVAASPPRMPLISTVTGNLMSDADASSAEYWATQLRHPVRFDLACQALTAEEPPKLLVELGMGTALRFLFGVMSQQAKGSAAVAIPGRLPEGASGYPSDSLARGELDLWTNGLALPSWAAPERSRVVFGLPGYPFQRQRCWVDPPPPVSPTASGDGRSTAARSDGTDAPAPGRTIVESILEVIRRQSRRDLSAADLGKPFHDLGFDSLFLVQLAEGLSAEFGTSIGLRLLLENDSIERLAKQIELRIPKKEPKVAASRFSPTLSSLPMVFRGLHVVQEGNGELPLLVIHGDRLMDALPKHLGMAQTIAGYVHQGADGDEIQLTSVEALARNCIAEWLSAFGTRPVAIGGHSYGGLIAFHAYSELVKIGVEVPLLFLLDTQHPSVFFPAPLSNLHALHVWTNSMIARRKAASDVRKARKAIKRLGRVPLAMRSDYTIGTYILAIGDYRPVTIDADLLLFRANANFEKFADNGWARGTTGKVDVVGLPGSHMSVVREPEDIEFIGNELAARLSALRKP